MARSLVIVESPAKAKTINKYLGRNYLVKASYGHVMDLPKKTIGILLPGARKRQKEEEAQGQGRRQPEKKVPKPVVVTAENIFEPTYEVIPGKMKVIHDLQKAARGADAVYLAGDPDREGEAICAHLAEILGKPKKYADLVVHEEKARRAKRLPSPPPRKNRPRQRRAAENLRVMFNEITPKAIKAAFEHPPR